jgi:hypothetical protein
MDQWDEKALREINDLDAARLAIRGALSTIRDLQDANVSLKGSFQDEQAKRKHLEAQVVELNERLAQWQERADAWDKDRAERDRSLEEAKKQARLDVRGEERARLDDDRRRTEEIIAGLRADISSMARGSQAKESAWGELRAQLEKRDADISALRREKEEAHARALHELDLVEQLRVTRDREVAASIASREHELQDRENQIAALKRANDELKKDLAALAAEQDLRQKSREEVLAKAYALKEKDLVERYHRREAELQNQWSELEQGLWAKARESRAQLDSAVQKQFEERARALESRAKEIEGLLVGRKAELDADHERRCSEAEARYADNERRLVAAWSDKEKRLIARVEGEIEIERMALREDWQRRSRELEAEYAERLRQADSRLPEYEREYKHKAQRLLEDSARKDAERVRTQDEYVSLKAAELDRLHETRLAEVAERRRLLEEEARSREERRQADVESRRVQLAEELEKRRIELLDEHRKTVASESAALLAQFEQRTRALDEDYRAKVAEVERAAKSLADQHESWKASLREEYLRKEKDLDSRWSARESSLVRKYETALEDQRRSFNSEMFAFRDQSEQSRRRVEDEALSRELTLRAAFAKDLSELREEKRRAP